VTTSKNPQTAAIIRLQELPESDCGSVSSNGSRAARPANPALTVFNAPHADEIDSRAGKRAGCANDLSPGRPARSGCFEQKVDAGSPEETRSKRRNWSFGSDSIRTDKRSVCRSV
jgi:hypothetical protein